MKLPDVSEAGLTRVHLYRSGTHGKLTGKPARTDNPPSAGYFRGRAGSVLVTAQHATPGRSSDAAGNSHGSQRGFRASHRPVPAGVAGALLPHAGLGPRRRGPATRDHDSCVAVLR